MGTACCFPDYGLPPASGTHRPSGAERNLRTRQREAAAPLQYSRCLATNIYACMDVRLFPSFQSATAANSRQQLDAHNMQHVLIELVRVPAPRRILSSDIKRQLRRASIMEGLCN